MFALSNASRAVRAGATSSTPQSRAGRPRCRPETPERARIPVRLETDVAAAALGDGNGAQAEEAHICHMSLWERASAPVSSSMGCTAWPFHPEVGHMRVPRAGTGSGLSFSGEADFKGVCIHHGDCLEGLASGPPSRPAGEPHPKTYPPHPAWRLEADYSRSLFPILRSPHRPTASLWAAESACMKASSTWSPAACTNCSEGYIQTLDSAEAIRGYIVRAELGGGSGHSRAAQLGREAAQNNIGG